MYLGIYVCVNLPVTCTRVEVGFTVWILQVLSWVRESYNESQP